MATGDRDGHGDEVPVQRHVRDVDVVRGGQTTSPSARCTVELHHDADGDVSDGPDHEQPDDGRVDVPLRVEIRDGRTDDERSGTADGQNGGEHERDIEGRPRMRALTRRATMVSSQDARHSASPMDGHVVPGPLQSAMKSGRDVQ